MSPRILACLLVLLIGCEGVPGDGSDAGSPDAGDGGAPDAGPPDAGPACGAEVPAQAGTVHTTGGAYLGLRAGGTWAYLGVPFARPPVGPLRLRPPLPAACAPGPHPATTFGPRCPQRQEDGGVVGAEDCLTLNVWAPDGARGAPVLFFLHGGGNVAGAAVDPLYDGRLLAEARGAVVVTAAYRLAALGWLAHPALDAEGDAGVSGNYGLLDQQLALDWVQANIAAFGGDPAKVLLFGESAGALDSLVHYVAPGSRGRMAAVLAESGGLTTQTLAQAEAEHAQVVAALGCADAGAGVPACLRALPAEVMAAYAAGAGPLDPGLHFRPVVDGVVLPAPQLTLIAQGRANPVPLVLGTNADETSRMVPPVTTDAEYQAAIRGYVPLVADQVLAHYPSSAFASPRQALVRVTTDAIWTCPMRELARAVGASDRPVYRYFFTWRTPGVLGQVVGATHGLELPFVFGTFSALGFAPSTPDLALSALVQGHWASLAATGQPGSGWLPWTLAGDEALALDTTSGMVSGVRTADCDFWASLAP